MTSPIGFSTMFYPRLDDDADGVLPEQTNADTAAANFALINAYFARNPTRVFAIRNVQAINLLNPLPNDGSWQPYTTAQWPPLTFTLPTSTIAMLVTVSAQIYANVDGAQAACTYRIAGAGLPAGAGPYETALWAGGGHAYGSRTTMLCAPGATLVSGKSVTITPHWLSANANNHGYSEGRMEVLCLYGGPQP